MLRPPIQALPSVIVVTEKVMREADGPVGRAALTAHFGWKGDRPEVRLRSRSGEPVRSQKKTSWNFQKADTQFSVLRVHCPKERSKAKVVENYHYAFCADQGTIETVYRTIISVNQHSINGAVSNLREECKTYHVRAGRPVLAGQSDPLFVPTSVMKTHTPLTDDHAPEEDLLQKYQERIENLSQQNRLIKCCADAGLLTTVEVGQYFMTKDTEQFSQFTDSVACREYTLPRDEKSSDPKGWIRGNTKIGPYWKSQPATYKVSMEWRLELSL